MRRFMMRSGYTSAAVALFARMTVQPTGARKRLINRTIKRLISEGVWDKLDAFYVTAAHTAQAASLNWKGATFPLATVSSPTFTADRGYSGDGVDDNLTTGYVPGVSGTMGVNDSHLGVWIQDNAAPITACAAGVAWIGVWPNTGGTLRTSCGNYAFNDTLRGDTSPGHLAVSRAGSSTTYKQFKDGSVFATITQATTTIGAYPIRLLCYTDTIGNLQYFETRRVAAAHWGPGLSDAQMAGAKAALAGYMTGVGA